MLILMLVILMLILMLLNLIQVVLILMLIYVSELCPCVVSKDKYLMISLRIYLVINVKSPIDAYRLTTVRVIEMFASC